MNFSELVLKAMDLSTSIHTYWDREKRKRHPNYPLVETQDDGIPPPPEDAELRALLRSLQPSEFYKLMAMVELGQSLFPASEFAKRWQELIREQPDREEAIVDLLERTYLQPDLYDGMYDLAGSGIEVDTVQPATV